MAEGWAREWIRERPEISDTFLVASIALDSTAVYANNNNDCNCADGEVCELKSVKTKAIQAMAQEGVDISKNTPKTFQQILPDVVARLPIDFLVVLCSCGLEKDISENCRHIRQWYVEAPTAAAKLEGDNAYRRVSLDIKERVHSLMEELHRGE
jgi:protein-tyrosine-phosphatase